MAAAANVARGRGRTRVESRGGNSARPTNERETLNVDQCRETAVTILAFAGVACAESVTVTPAVQQNCEWDYHNFCDQYAIGSELLDMCFKQNGPKLSKPCVDALIAAGDTSQEYVDQQKKLLGK